ncbi:hypothetical protein AAF463_24920 (plasmid) [Pantoea sp. BJ2]|uniref:Surface presentation of antigen domain-containing protein n=1 Tax=Pantoea sp. BJ2 TaxID=3141322 RepID=A0AAU7U3N3_9GAMM
MDKVIVKHHTQFIPDFEEGNKADSSNNKKKKSDADALVPLSAYVAELRHLLDDSNDLKPSIKPSEVIAESHKPAGTHLDVLPSKVSIKEVVTPHVRQYQHMTVKELPLKEDTTSPMMSVVAENKMTNAVLPRVSEITVEELSFESEVLSPFKVKSGESLAKNAENTLLIHHRVPEPVTQQPETRMQSAVPVNTLPEARSPAPMISQNEHSGSKSITYSFRRVDETGKTSVDINLSGSQANPVATITPSSTIVRERLDAAMNMPDAPSLTLKGEEQKEQQHRNEHNDIWDEEEV